MIMSLWMLVIIVILCLITSQICLLFLRLLIIVSSQIMLGRFWQMRIMVSCLCLLTFPNLKMPSSKCILINPLVQMVSIRCFTKGIESWLVLIFLMSAWDGLSTIIFLQVSIKSTYILFLSVRIRIAWKTWDLSPSVTFCTRSLPKSLLIDSSLFCLRLFWNFSLLMCLVKPSSIISWSLFRSFTPW